PLKSNDAVSPSYKEDAKIGSNLELEENSGGEGPASVAKTLSAPSQEENMQIVKDEKRANAPSSTALAPAPSSQNEIALSIPELKKEKSSSNKKTAKESERSGKYADAASVEDSFVSSCYYTGGEEALFKDLRKLLKEKEVLLKFN